MFGAFGKALATSVTFVSKAALKNPAVRKLGLAKPLVAVEEHAQDRQAGHEEQRPRCREIDVDPETYEVRADGELLDVRAGERAADGAAVFPVLACELGAKLSRN